MGCSRFDTFSSKLVCAFLEAPLSLIVEVSARPMPLDRFLQDLDFGK
jgi:hypothetical protein